MFNSVEYYLCNGDDDGHKNIKKAVGLINKMTTWPVHHIFGTCLCHHYISMLQVKFDLRLKLFYLCWFFNFLCLLGLEDKQTYESTCNLGQKVLRIFHFLNHRMPILWIWYCYGTPPLTPPWSKFFSRDQKWSSQTSTLFLWGQGRGGGGNCSCQCFQVLYLETRHGNVSTVLSKIVHVG